MHRNSGLVLSFLLVALSLTSCLDRPVYSESMSIEEGRWAVDNPARFDFEISDTLQDYDMWVTLRNGSQYPYSNIYLFVKTNFPNGRTKVDTLECILADERGVWHGSGLGDLKSNTFAYRSGFRFPLTGDYSVSIHHAMRMDEVPDIYDVGLELQHP